MKINLFKNKLSIEISLQNLRKTNNINKQDESLETDTDGAHSHKRFQSSDLFDFAIFPFALLTRVQ